MATAQPEPSPNPNALRFALNVALPGTLSFRSAEEAAGDPFGSAVFAAPGVISIFGVNDFVTVTREGGADWQPIIDAVQSAAGDYL